MMPRAVAGSVAISDVIDHRRQQPAPRSMTFTVVRSGGTAAFNVNYATADGTATTADGDYVAQLRHPCSSPPTR